MNPHRYLSRVIGQPVRCRDGTEVGHVVDVTVRLDVTHPAIHRIAIGRGRRMRLLAPWSLVERLEGDQVVLAVDRDAMERYAVDRAPALEPHELLLCRDVIDSQVVDVAGRRLSRVSDVVMIQNDLQGRDLEVVAVDIGVGSVLRRVGLRRMGERIAPVIVDWDDLHLVSERGHTAQLSTSTSPIDRRNPQELAELLARLSTRKATDVIRQVGPDRSAAALHASHPEHRGRLLRGLEPSEAQDVIAAASPAKARDLAEAHREPRRRRFLRTAGWRVHHPPSSNEREEEP
jgi:sporulation protein YlmC with PRC-barrel domain